MMAPRWQLRLEAKIPAPQRPQIFMGQTPLARLIEHGTAREKIAYFTMFYDKLGGGTRNIHGKRLKVPPLPETML